MSQASEQQLQDLRERMKQLDEAFDRLRHAYYSRTAIEGRLPEYEDLKAAAEAFIKASYDYQKARYGRIRLRLSVSKLLR